MFPSAIGKSDLIYSFFSLATYLGDSLFLLPLSAGLAAGLLWQSRSLAVRFGFVVAADLVLTLSSKLWFYASGGSPYLNILSPSGHASLSITVYGCCALVLASRRQWVERVFIFGIATVVALAIIVSRIVLYAHTPEEAVFGSLIGGVCVAMFSAGSVGLQKLRPRLPAWLVAMLLAGTMSVWMLGREVKTEPIIQQWGTRIGATWESL